jgi:hypothetical protein
MATLFTDDKPYMAVMAGLRALNYTLLEENYGFVDWFASRKAERQVAVAAFGQIPISYDSACIGVVYSNGLREQTLVDQYRSLGAPILLEIDQGEVREWAVSRTAQGHALISRYPVEQISEMFASRASDWKPEPLLRAKNIGEFHWTPQLSLFAGLLPELESHIQKQLDPLLRKALFKTKATYRARLGYDPDPTQLFKLIFWLLAAKVFKDRRLNGFASLGSDPDQLLDAIAKKYKTLVPRLLNLEARQVAANLIWTELDFRNLSVEVLCQMWANMLIDPETKKHLGIHRTSRTIVRYMIEHIFPFMESGDDKRIILEPCSGSAVFLIGAMNALRHNLFGMDPAERHTYFVKHLVAVEQDPFGVEISRLALTLADFPNIGGWEINPDNVFRPGALTNNLRRAGAVLCNPPFSDFKPAERQLYQVSSPKKPVALLDRVLDDLHPSGVIGFVLPRNALDGQGYKKIRKRLAERFATLELTVLPDRAFDADSEIGLLIATEPIPHNVCRVVNFKVNDSADDWTRFELRHEVAFKQEASLGIDRAAQSLALPQLFEVWDFLSSHPTLKDFAELRRGIEWNKKLIDPKTRRETGWRSKLVKEKEQKGFELGVAPRTHFNVFEVPRLYYLSLRPEDERGHSFRRAWKKPKAIVNKSTHSRRHWRMAAFADSEGVPFYQTYIGVWPTSERYDEWLLAAVLNSPVANAFVATREGKTDNTKEILNLIPMPYFTDAEANEVRSLVGQYQTATSTWGAQDEASRLLMQIDAIVLDAYRMPPKLETEILNFFRGASRPTSHSFGDYLPPDCEVYFSLSDHLSPKFRDASAGELLKRTGLG